MGQYLGTNLPAMYNGDEPILAFVCQPAISIFHSLKEVEYNLVFVKGKPAYGLCNPQKRHFGAHSTSEGIRMYRHLLYPHHLPIFTAFPLLRLWLHNSPLLVDLRLCLFQPRQRIAILPIARGAWRQNLAKHGTLPIQMWSGRKCNEKLTPVDIL